MQDLLKHTPSNHPDHPLLQDALRISQNFLSSINEEITPRRQSMTVKKGEVSTVYTHQIDEFISKDIHTIVGQPWHHLRCTKKQLKSLCVYTFKSLPLHLHHKKTNIILVLQYYSMYKAGKQISTVMLRQVTSQGCTYIPPSYILSFCGSFSQNGRKKCFNTLPSFRINTRALPTPPISESADLKLDFLRDYWKTVWEESF